MRRRFTTGTLSPFVLFALLTLGQSQARAELIDSFETSQSLMAASFMTTDSGSVTGSGIIGGERDAVVTWTSGPVFSELDVVSAGTGFLSFSLGADTNGSTALTWDGNDSSSADDFTGLDGVDLTDGNMSNAMRFDVVFDDLPVDVNITVWTDASNASNAILSLPGGIVTSTDFDVFFASFATILGTGADFSDVGMIRVEIDAAMAATDVLVDSINTVFVPEPASFFMMGISLFGLAIGRRRRR